MTMRLSRIVQDKTASAIGAVGFPRRSDGKIDERVAQSAAAPVAPHSARFDMNCLGWLHICRLSYFVIFITGAPAD
jgi:hypothetical protein